MANDLREPQPTVVYIHGAGRQAPADELKTSFDEALFGGPGPSVVARYSDLVWGTNGLIANGGEDVLNEIASSRPPADIAAGRVVSLVGGDDAGLLPDGSDDARRLVACLLKRADLLQARADRAGEAMLLPGDARFRRLAGIVGSDVVGYLFFGWADAMRAPVIEVLEQIPDPIILVAHSLGSIIGYDLLCRRAYRDRSVRLFVTAGSPLGIDTVRERLNDRAGPGTLPTALPLWANYADPDDLVPCLDPNLGSNFTPPPRITDDVTVNNPCGNNHDLPGYLGLQAVRTLVRGVIDTGWPPPG